MIKILAVTYILSQYKIVLYLLAKSHRHINACLVEVITVNIHLQNVMMNVWQSSKIFSSWKLYT